MENEGIEFFERIIIVSLLIISGVAMCKGIMFWGLISALEGGFLFCYFFPGKNGHDKEGLA